MEISKLEAELKELSVRLTKLGDAQMQELSTQKERAEEQSLKLANSVRALHKALNMTKDELKFVKSELAAS